MDKIAEASGLGRASSDQQSRCDAPSNVRRQESSFCHQLTCVISRTLNWRRSSQSTKDKSCQEVILKDDSGTYAVFTEQDAAASHMTGGKGL